MPKDIIVMMLNTMVSVSVVEIRLILCALSDLCSRVLRGKTRRRSLRMTPLVRVIKI